MRCVKEVKTEHVDVEKLFWELSRHEALVRTDPRVTGGSLAARDPLRMTMSASTRRDLIDQGQICAWQCDGAKFRGVPVDINDSLPFGEIVITERVG